MKKYTYGIGASWVLELPGYAGQKRRVIYSVTASRLKRNTEYYDLEIREQGKEVQQIEDMSASRLHYLINFHCIEKLSSGRAADYPLTAAEVTEYYKTLTADKERRCRLAHYVLQASKAYQETQQKKRSAEIQAAKAEAEGDETRAAMITDQIRSHTARLDEIKAGYGIKDGDLTMAFDCPVCKDRGVLGNGEICACAKAREKEIRAFVAEELGA